MTPEEILRQLNIKKDHYNDLHVIRNFSSFVAISNGRIVAMTDPWMQHCPLFSRLYVMTQTDDREIIKQGIREAVEGKIKQFGLFTGERQLHREDIAVPYGASEMMMYGLTKKGIDATVTACDGAGTVIAVTPSLVQGIGSRMNGLFYTTPIKEVIQEIESQQGTVVFPETAEIDQVKGVEKAAQMGYHTVAVTINGFTEEDLRCLRDLEEDYSITVVCIIVCTTGITQERTDHIAQYADLVWSCASGEVRETIGRKSILQITIPIPVFVVTEKGMKFASFYCSNPAILQNLDTSKQYLIANTVKGTPLTMGMFSTYLTEANLPLRGENDPR
ncbi:MAG: DUF2099 family protein [Deltaproteobacteria bacterium]|nr:DUF2099 family protein [Deltaproteobacteria bacterium]